MPTLRDQLRSRRATYLERVAVFDYVRNSEENDIRVASVRGFLEGGDDLPPECEGKGVKRERRRLPGFIDAAEVKVAAAKIDAPEGSSYKGAEPSSAGDWDQFLKSREGWGETDLFRILAQLKRATEYFRAGFEIPPHQVLDHGVSELPALGDRDDPVRKAWHLLLTCGANNDKLSKGYLGLIQKIGTVETKDANVTALLGKIVSDWIDKFPGRKWVGDGQGSPPVLDQPEREWDETCPCQRKPPEKKDPGGGATATPPPTLDATIRECREAIYGALKTDSPQAILDEFRFIGMTDELIAQILRWLKLLWDEIPPVYQAVINEGKFVFQVPNPDDSGAKRLDAELTAHYVDVWAKVVETLTRLRKVPQYFIGISQKSVGEVCAELVKGPEGDDRDGAVDRAVAGGREDGPFRLAALLNEPEGYLVALDKIGPEGEGGTGANGLARPTFTALSAFYWRMVVIPSTIGHILRMKDTADFHIAHHLRFLGLYRPGGRYRTGKPENEKYETYIKQLVPDWLISFMTAALLRVKYWLDDAPLNREEGEEMTYWSENHQMLFASAEYILPSWVGKEETFAYTGKSASWHQDRARPRMKAWLDHRIRLGYSEMNSGTYYNQHLPGLFNLVDFSPEEEIRKRALIALDLMIFDIVRRSCRGSFVAASGRQYWASKTSGWRVSVLDTIQLLSGSVGDFWGSSESSAVSFVTSRYIDEIPEVLLAIPHDTAAPRIDRSRTSINLEESEDYDIDPESSEGIVFWWGNGGYFTDDTYRATQSWSYRWGLRDTGSFKFFYWVDWAGVRLISSVVTFATSFVGLAVTALSMGAAGYVLAFFKPMSADEPGAEKMYPGGFPVALLNTALVTPRLVRKYVDIVLGVIDVALSLGTAVLKAFKLLDKNDDRVRVAMPALEQEFRELAITFNSGSVLEREHLYGWRSQDAMLTSLNDNHKGGTAFQTEPCVATLGMNVTVFTGKRVRTKDEHDFWSDLGQGLEGYVKGAARYAYDPEVFLTAPLGVFGGESAPELGAALVPALAGEIFGGDGPGYWFGNLSLPLVFQQENVAISIYSPSDLQDDLGPEETHAHWPFDHFDEIRTDERNGGRWVFGRRDRRFPPRTPCEPVASRPTNEKPWAEGKRREEGGSGSGYVALFSARGMKTSPGGFYGHRELIAEGIENIWITVVGDRATYHSFGEFYDDVLAATVSVDLDDLKCSITMPEPGSAKDGRKGKTFEVTWDDGVSFDGKKLETDGWPRFEWKRSSIQADPGPVSDYDLLIDDVLVTSKSEPGKGRVDWDEKAWQISATVRAWEEVEVDGKKKWVAVRKTISADYDLSKEDKVERQASAEGIQTYHPRAKPSDTVTEVTAASLQQRQKTAKSVLGQRFRATVKEVQLRR